MNDIFHVQGRRFLITGASSGIGRALAVGIARRGGVVHGMARSPEGLEGTKELCDGRFTAVQGDVTDQNSVERLMAQLAKGGGLDVLVNNAGADHQAPIEQTTDADWNRVQVTTLSAVYSVSRAAGPLLKASSNGGSVINVASVLGSRGIRNNTAYVAAKHGVVGFTKALALEWARQGVRVNAIAPGFIATEMTLALRDDPRVGPRIRSGIPMGRWGDPEDLLGAALFLGSDASAFVTGSVLTVDGGLDAQ